MKWANIIAVILLALALVVETVFLVKRSGDQQQLNNQILELEQKNQASENASEKLVEENADLKDEVEKNQQENASFASNVAKLEQEVSTLTTENTKLDKDLKAKSDRAMDLVSENSAMKKKFMCAKTLSTIDFTNNESVNKSLKQYVKDTKNRSEDISASYWNLIWTGEKYSTHTVEVYSEKDRMNYIWKFTVYFRGEAYGDHENGIFYNDHQCWLYLDK